MRPQEIKQLIETNLQTCTAHIGSEDGRHFNAVIIGPIFAGKNRVERQQLVYTALGTYIQDGTIHAISFKTLTEEEWQAKQQSGQHG